MNTRLGPVKRRGNHRYFQRKDVILIRQIRALLYKQGYTICGARSRLSNTDAEQASNQVVIPVDDAVRELEQLLD